MLQPHTQVCCRRRVSASCGNAVDQLMAFGMQFEIFELPLWAAFVAAAAAIAAAGCCLSAVLSSAIDCTEH
jgi:hypothetical protein